MKSKIVYLINKKIIFTCFLIYILIFNKFSKYFLSNLNRKEIFNNEKFPNITESFNTFSVL